MTENLWQFLVDATRAIAVGYRRDKSHSDIREVSRVQLLFSAASQVLGCKPVMLTTLDGTPYGFELVRANADKRVTADQGHDTLSPGRV
jgi:hypothetical protein